MWHYSFLGCLVLTQLAWNVPIAALRYSQVVTTDNITIKNTAASATTDEIGVIAWIAAGVLCTFGQQTDLSNFVNNNCFRVLLLCSHSSMYGQPQGGFNFRKKSGKNWYESQDVTHQFPGCNFTLGRYKAKMWRSYKTYFSKNNHLIVLKFFHRDLGVL